MSFWKSLFIAKEFACAVAMDILSMGGFWVVDGKTKTGQLIEELIDAENPQPQDKEVKP